MADIIICVVEKAALYLLDPILRLLKYLFCFSTNVQNLHRTIDELRLKRNTVQHMVNAAGGDDVTDPDVLNWLKKVDEANEEVEDTLEAIGNVKCVNIKSRYVLNNKATKICKEILGLGEKGNFQRVVYPAPQVQVPCVASQDFRGFESRMFTRKQVLEALEDSSTSVIGIYGTAGVGKTVMAKEIADHVKKEKTFGKVAIAVVSQNPEHEKEESKNQIIKKIQDQLADELKFSISEKNSLHARTQIISTTLQKERNQRTLIILDDLWHGLDLQTIGIPTIGLRKGLKVLLTSRFQEVCNNTGAQKIFEVEVLAEEEAWNLFKETARIADDATDMEGVAKEVAKECGRLPLAIVIVAKALGNKKVESAWFDVLEQLRYFSMANLKGVHDFVYSLIEWSYNYLESKEAKSVLLLCSLFQEDFNIPIEHLVMYAKGLKLFEKIDTMKETRDRMDSVIHNLKDCYLLLNGNSENFVKMHDVVRDVCLIISSNKQLGYMASHFGIMEGLQNGESKPYTAASLTLGQLDQLSFHLDCSDLQLLRLSFENIGEFLDIPIDFLQGINSLKVLHFEKVNIQSSLPLHCLMSICSLCLDYCELDQNVSNISSLVNLQILSFFKCDLHDFPKGIEKLSNLKSLNLRFKTCPDPLPKGILPRLKKLEELYLEDYCQRRNAEDAEISAHPFDEEHVLELNSLPHLNIIVILGMECTIFQEQVLKGLHLADTTRFYIRRWSLHRRWSLEQEIQVPRGFRRTLEVRDIDKEILGDPNMSRILKKTESLTLEWAKGLKNLVPELEKDGFVSLRDLRLQSGDYSYLIDATTLVSENIFHNLEFLELKHMENLIEICNGKLPVGSFRRLQRLKLNRLPKMMHLWRHSIQLPSLCNLRQLHVSYCPEIRSLFPQSILKCLVLLKVIDIFRCGNLEEIVSIAVTEILELPKLESLSVWKTKFRSFCIDSDTKSSAGNEGPLQAMLNLVSLPNIISLQVINTNGPEYVIGGQMRIGTLNQLRHITLRYCQKLRSFFVPLAFQYYHPAQLLPSLESIVLDNCSSVEVLFDFEGMMINDKDNGQKGEHNFTDSKLFDRLQYIELWHIDGLMQIWRMPSGTTEGVKAFQNLRMLTVFKCGSLRHLLSTSMAQMLVGLEELKIEDCNKMEEVIATGEDTCADAIMLPKLRILKLYNLQNLRAVFGGNNNSFNINDELLVFPSLNELQMGCCPMLTKFYAGKNLSASNLERVKIIVDDINSPLIWRI